MSSAELDPETPPTEPQRPPPIDKGPPRPAPTRAYDFKEYEPRPQILYVRTSEQAKTVLGMLSQSGPFGFDLEWRPTYKKGAPENPVALIQLSNAHFIMLFQVSGMLDFPSELKWILESSQIVKAGVGIQGDAKKLFKDCNVSMSNCVDLSLLARTVDNARWAGTYNSPIGLARLIECYEYRLLLKGKISRSDWTASLSPKQQEYAGNDAHAGYILYKKFEAMIPLVQSQPKAAWYSFNVRQGVLYNDEGILWRAENPNYDPGPQPEPKPLTEAQLRRKQKRAASATTQAPCVKDDTSVDFVVQLQPQPLTATSPNQVPVSGHHFAGKQTVARNNFLDPHLQSTLTNRGGPSRNPQSTAEVSQPRTFSTYTGKKRAPSISHWPHAGHTASRLLSVNTRDNPLPSTTHVGANP